jgi:trehalose-6-phosphate synthase
MLRWQVERGRLLIERFTGAARELRDAVVVNPSCKEVSSWASKKSKGIP